MDSLQVEVRWAAPCIYTIEKFWGFQTFALSGKAPWRTLEDCVRAGDGPPLVLHPGCSWIPSRLRCDGPHPAYTPSKSSGDFRLLRYRGKHRGEPWKTVFVPRRTSARLSSGVFMDSLQVEVRWAAPCIYTIEKFWGFQTFALSGKAPWRTLEDCVRAATGLQNQDMD